MLNTLAREGVDLRSGVSDVGVGAAGARLEVVARGHDGEQLIEGGHLLVATGRKANVEGLPSIALDRRRPWRHPGEPRAQDRQPVGLCHRRCRGQGQFTRLTNYHAGLVIRNALFRLPVKVNDDLVPR